MACGASVVKYLLFFFNFIFFIAGVILIVIGGLFLNSDFIASLPSGANIEVSMYAAYLSIVVGCIVFIVAFFGCCGAIRENTCMIITFAVLLGIILVLELAVGILGFVFRGKVNDFTSDVLQKTMDQYGTKNDSTKFWDVIQTELDCCGWDGPNEWIEKGRGRIPPSCCADADKDCSVSTAYQAGCKEKSREWFDRHMLYFAGFGIVLCLLQILGIVFACCLASSIRSANVRV